MVNEKSIYEGTLPGLGRRDTNRYPIPANVMLIPLDGKSEPVWVTTEDISARGIFINAQQSLPEIDSVLMLKIVTCPHERPLRIKARVVHRIEGLGIGCKFIDMTPTTSRRLSAIVAEAAAAPPSHRAVH